MSYFKMLKLPKMNPMVRPTDPVVTTSLGQPSSSKPLRHDNNSPPITAPIFTAHSYGHDQSVLSFRSRLASRARAGLTLLQDTAISDRLLWWGHFERRFRLIRTVLVVVILLECQVTPLEISFASTGCRVTRCQGPAGLFGFRLYRIAKLKRVNRYRRWSIISMHNLPFHLD